MHVLPSRDDPWRVICDCQRHALLDRSFLRRATRGFAAFVSGAKRNGLAIVIGLPIAFGAIGIPTEAMDISALRELDRGLTAVREAFPRAARRPDPAPPVRTLPVFTTGRTREELLDPQPRRTLTFEALREEFFRTEIPYGAIIYREARRNRLSPELVAAVVAAESDFRPRLISNKNAQGLMQIVPGTARLLGLDDVFDPEENIAAGARYLRYLFDRFPDQRIALAAYNAGEGNVEKFGGVPPFPETRTYLNRVTARTSHYRLRLRRNYAASLRMTGSLSE
ncbi:MAG TPA: transglycosylase SLT domain-containing protein [Thermoanaerobaculia bacterium]|nr:transglycosylase SLT domain-containing protein [Thermoanaerobaculia bacterium]